MRVISLTISATLSPSCTSLLNACVPIGLRTASSVACLISVILETLPPSMTCTTCSSGNSMLSIRLPMFKSYLFKAIYALPQKRLRFQYRHCRRSMSHNRNFIIILTLFGKFLLSKQPRFFQAGNRYLTGLPYKLKIFRFGN